MEGSTELRACWEFAATWKLLQLLSIPLCFSVPTPTQLEEAFLNPSENIPLLANIHGRLLGLSVGVSAAKKWLTNISRFVRQRPYEFSHILEDAVINASSKEEPEPSLAEVKEEPQQEPQQASEHGDDVDQIHPAASPNVKPFPREEDEYCRLRPLTRLLVLHTIAEIVLSEHESSLCAGSISDIPVEDMRVYPIAGDAAGNDYYYFGDTERIYREPGRKLFKTRLEKAEEDARAAEKAAKEAAIEAARLEKEEKRKEADRARKEARQKREEKKRKSMERWAPRVAATRTTRASRRAELSLLEGSANSASKNEAINEPQHTLAEESYVRSRRGRRAESTASKDVTAQTDATERRSSGRRRKPSNPEDSSLASQRTQKRPRRSETFEDPELRICDEWQLLSSGADALRDVLQRFRPDMVTVLPSEKVLVRKLEEEVLPDIEEREEKLRKEQEKTERKRRNELLHTFTKRSSRVQALEQKREEAARRAAEEEKREQELEKRKLNYAETVKAQVANLERDQARDIVNARRAHGRTEAIMRDEQLQLTMDRKAARDTRTEAAEMRRSSRSTRGSSRSLRADLEGSHTREDTVRTRSHRSTNNATRGKLTTVENDSDSQGTNNADVAEQNAAERVDGEEMRVGLADDKPAPEVEEEASVTESDVPNSVEKSEATQQVHADSARDVATNEGLLSSAIPENAIEDSYTWLTNPDDGEPIRVLDKFFFAAKASFEDAPLEILDSKNGTEIIGFGILVPPFSSDAKAQRVELGKVEDWVIEYGTEPKLWTKSPSAWYELRDPALQYRSAFASTRRKYELCIRISILGASFKTADLSYSSVVDLLGLRYHEMLSFSEAQILKEKRFIISQMESLNIKALMQSGFIRELRKKIKAEDAKAMKAEMLTVNKSRHEFEAKDNKEAGSTKLTTERPTNNGSRPKRRASISAKPAVPRAVSAIITGLLRAATKSSQPVRKRKRTSDTKQKKSGALSTSPIETSNLRATSSMDDDSYWVHVPVKKPKVLNEGENAVRQERASLHLPSEPSGAIIKNENLHEQVIPNRQALASMNDERDQTEPKGYMMNGRQAGDSEQTGGILKRDSVTLYNGMRKVQVKSTSTPAVPSNGIAASINEAANSEYR